MQKELLNNHMSCTKKTEQSAESSDGYSVAFVCQIIRSL